VPLESQGIKGMVCELFQFSDLRAYFFLNAPSNTLVGFGSNPS
jgi:hypothetical protein